MLEKRVYPASTMINETHWWVTGGWNTQKKWIRSTEVYDSRSKQFQRYVDMPKGLSLHNLVKVNQTHFVILGGQVTPNQAYMFDRYEFRTRKNVAIENVKAYNFVNTKK